MAAGLGGDRGGIGGLLDLLTENGGAVRADLLRYYGLRFDPRDPDLPWDELRDLVSHLPRESATVRAQVGEQARWGETEHLLAVVIDVLQAQAWQFASAHSKKKPKRPKPYPRPGVADPSRRKFGTKRMSLAEAREWMARKKGGVSDGS